MDKDLRLDYLPNHPELKIYQHKKMIKINTDTQVLGEFIEVYKEDVVLDIGTNTGALLLYANMFKPKKLIGLDINEEALKVCEINMKLHNITNYELICDNAMTYVGEEVDVIVCNPPYFKTDENNKSNDKYLNLAKHESEFTLEGMIKTAYKNLKLNPNLIICDCLKYQTNEKYDIIYVDPPWDMDYKPIILKANELLSADGVIILEYDKTKNIDIQNILDELNIDISLVKSKKYGRCLLAILRKIY